MRGVTPRRSRTQGRGRAGPGSGASTAAINTTRNGENTGTCKAALQAALAHPLARPPLALAESGLLDTVPVVLVRLVVSRVVGRLGHAAKGHGTHHMRKAVRSCNAGGRGVSQLSERAGAAMPCNNPTPRIASSPLIVSRPRQPKRLCVSRLTSTTDAGDHRLATGATAQRHPESPGSPSYPFFLRASPRPQAWRSRAYITFQSTCGPKEGRERKRTSYVKTSDFQAAQSCRDAPAKLLAFGAGTGAAGHFRGGRALFRKRQHNAPRPRISSGTNGARRTSALHALSLSKSSPGRGPISIISSRARHRGVAWHAASPTPSTATGECLHAGST